MHPDAHTPAPRRSEYHPTGYPYSERFPELRPYQHAEGGTVFLADTPDGFYVVTDEGSMAEFLEPGDSTVGIHAFDSAADRKKYCAARFAPHARESARAGSWSGHADVRLSYKGRAVPDFAALLDAYGDADLRSPGRSTVPLLAHWRSWDNALAGFEGVIGEALARPVELAFEYRVAVRDGRGTPSHTDLMVITPAHAVAVEAKRSEPAYDSVAQWLGKAADGNRKTVLEGWLALINETVGASLTVERVAGCTYQLIHRTASACEPVAQRRVVVYQCFDVKPSSRDEYVRQMRELNALLGEQSTLRFYLLDCAMTPTSSYQALCARWAGGERSLAHEVRAGLGAGRLLASGGCSVTRI